MKYIQQNNPIYQCINWLTYQRILMGSKVDQTEKLGVNKILEPIWVSGLFRSGTSLTTRILGELGVDLGPEKHLLKAKGQRANWNPAGFYENYLFMDWSLSIFESLGAWGHEPPTEKQVSDYNVNALAYKLFVHESVVQIHDDRISNINKSKALRKYWPGNFHSYLEKEFNPPFAVKNPHFSVLSEVLRKHWPKGKFLMVYRNPDATISSAQKVVQTTDYELYINYYSRLLEAIDEEVIYFSYDGLMTDPEGSINALAQALGLETNKVKTAASLIDPTLYRHKTDMDQSQWPAELIEIYSELENRKING